MRHIITTSAFRKDTKRISKRGKDLAKLEKIVYRLVEGQPLEAKHKPHPLGGKWKPCWECHIEPDWLLIYQVMDEAVYLVRSGSHADLFG